MTQATVVGLLPSSCGSPPRTDADRTRPLGGGGDERAADNDGPGALIAPDRGR